MYIYIIINDMSVSPYPEVFLHDSTLRQMTFWVGHVTLITSLQTSL